MSLIMLPSVPKPSFPYRDAITNEMNRQLDNDIRNDKFS